MKKYLISLLLVAASFAASAACEDKFAFNQWPEVHGNYQALCRSGYAIVHDNGHKLPLMAAEHLSPETIGRGDVHRTDNFRVDRDLPPQARSTPKDYVHTIYDKGHLADAENAGTTELMSETFLMSNMTPQVFSINRGPWRALEMRVGSWVRNGRSLYVYTGVILGGNQTIGNGVAVPTQLFKVIIDVNHGDAIAFIMPNVEGSIGDWKQYRVTVADVERAIGVNLLQGANQQNADTLRHAAGLSLMPR